MALDGLTSMNRASSLMQQLLAHPNWKEGPEEQVEKNSFVIMRKDHSNFCVLWINKQGERVSVPFKISDEKFCFKNGQAHYSHRLNELIVEIFKHYT